MNDLSNSKSNRTKLHVNARNIGLQTKTTIARKKITTLRVCLCAIAEKAKQQHKERESATRRAPLPRKLRARETGCRHTERVARELLYCPCTEVFLEEQNTLYTSSNSEILSVEKHIQREKKLQMAVNGKNYCAACGREESEQILWIRCCQCAVQCRRDSKWASEMWKWLKSAKHHRYWLTESFKV